MTPSQKKKKTESFPKERRKHTRTDIRLPVYFIGIDNDGNEMIQDIAVVLDISEGGILMESAYIPPGANYVKILGTTKKNDIIDVKGKVVYSIKDGKGKFKLGISYQDTSDKILKFVKNFILNPAVSA